MNLTDTAQMARDMMADHGLYNGRFEFDGGKRRIGCTHFNHYGNLDKITLSRHFVVQMTEDQIKEVMFHEIAHALAGPNHGHDIVWKNIARGLGINPTRCLSPDNVVIDTHAWTGECAAGHASSKMHRAPRRIRSCGKCSPKVFNADHLITWSFNGKPASLEQMPESYRTEFVRTMGKRIPTYSY